MTGRPYDEPPAHARPSALRVRRALAESATARIWIDDVDVYEHGVLFVARLWQAEGRYRPLPPERETDPPRAGARADGLLMLAPYIDKDVISVVRGGRTGWSGRTITVWCGFSTVPDQLALVARWPAENLSGELQLDGERYLTAVRQARGRR